MRSRASRPLSRRLAAGLLALLASALAAPPAGAQEEDGGGWFDTIVDLLKRPEGAPVDVPLRKTDRAPAPEPLPAEPQATPPEVSEAATVQAPAPAAVETGALEEPPVAEAPPPAEEPAQALDEPAVAQPGAADAPVAQVPPPAEMPARIEGATLAHVHRAVRGLVADIRILREAAGAGDAPPAPEPVEGRAPVHLYVKTLEVWTKVAQAQRRHDVPAGAVGAVPPRAVDPADVLVNVEHLRNELGRVMARLGVARSPDPAPLEAAATAPAVYRGLAEASLLLDALRGGPLAPDDLYRHAATVLAEAALIAAALGTSPAGPPAAQAPKQPGDVAQLLLRAAYKMVNLQTRLQMDAAPVPAARLDRASPAQSYDALTVLLAELVRIRHHLGIDAAPDARPEPPGGQGWADVFARVQRIVSTIDRLSAAAAQ